MNPRDLYRLESEDEQLFREERLPQQKRMATIVLVLVLMPVIGFAGADLHFLEERSQLVAMLVARALVVLFSIAVLAFLRKASTPKAFDRILLGWSIVMAGFFLVISATRPADYLPVYSLTVLVVLGTYVVLPLNPGRQSFLALFLTLGELALWVFVKKMEAEVQAQVAIGTAFGLANVVGLSVSLQFHRFRRLEFVLGRHERELVQDLDRALSEVRALRGIIPICSQCKKVRRDDGYYEEVESYISRYADAFFSHTQCPDCQGEQEFKDGMDFGAED